VRRNFAGQFNSTVRMDTHSYVANSDINAIEALYQQYKSNPQSVDSSWQRFFEGFEFQRAEFAPLPGGDGLGSAVSSEVIKEFKVINLINGYRQRGHLFTQTNPVRERRKHQPTLALENFGLSDADLDIVFQAGNEIGLGAAKLRDILAHLNNSYCKHIGVEYTYVRSPERVQWLRERIEAVNKPTFSGDEKKQFLEMASKASLFEQYIHRKFVGAKRFSVEGCEAMVPAMDYMVRLGGDMGVKEFVIGMAHRGRLNVLTNIMGKPQEQVFAEFEGLEFEDSDNFDGDVKYHYGYSNDVTTAGGNQVHLTLCPNPSHLEAVNPVVEGLSRAKIDHYLKSEDTIVPVLVHGDAAIAGQGIMYEIVQMALLDGYRTGGTVHIVTNNQVGFTTNYLDGRSSTYCTDVAKTTLCPVFHVNADDVEAVIETMKIALEYRMKFHMDVFVDLLGYRKYGHNEGDEPKFTQPSLYKLIASHPSLREIYMNQLIAEGTIDQDYADGLKRSFEAMLDTKLEIAKGMKMAHVKHFMEETWKGFTKATASDMEASVKTQFDEKRLKAIATAISTLPTGEKFIAKTAKVFADRLKMIEENKLDWAMGELLAYGTLLEEGNPVRISGQDVERGTFSHRHAVVKTDEDQEKEIITLNSIHPKQAKFTVFNSLLSEYGVLGFDYGYAFGTPHGLTIWEAQFGDFNNGAQIIIDQFISAAEDKWRTMNGITLFLPHGYEGQGSEHSSARMERFLQLCAELNMLVCNPTSPANHFHLLRRQVLASYRKPLVVFTPKKLLRYPKAVSTIQEMAKGQFQEVIDDTDVKAKEVETIVLCSGKVYYDILEQKEKRQTGSTMAVVRLEQLYPLPEKQLRSVIAGYSKAKRIIWAQEEPENMGAWTYMLRCMRDLNLEVISPAASASPAAGSPKVHEKRMIAMMDRLFSYSSIKA
jgi:2-oxoglutarate dehydrogenase E1 component